MSWHSPGIVVSALGIVIAAAAAAHLGQSLTPLPTPNARGKFTRRGLYRFVRHPIYTGVLGAGFGAAWATHSPVRFAIIMALALFFDAKARFEERHLHNHYPEYLNYCRDVRRFVPFIY